MASGDEPGGRVALLNRTRYGWTVVDFAIWTAGGVTVPVYETSRAEQVAWNTGESGAVAIFDHIAPGSSAIATARRSRAGTSTASSS